LELSPSTTWNNKHYWKLGTIPDRESLRLILQLREFAQHEDHARDRSAVAGKVITILLGRCPGRDSSRQPLRTFPISQGSPLGSGRGVHGTSDSRFRFRVCPDQAAMRNCRKLTTLIEDRLTKETLGYDAIYWGRAEWKLLPPIDQPEEPGRCLVSGTGLTHLGARAIEMRCIAAAPSRTGPTA
jgi:hypothetical protein